MSLLMDALKRAEQAREAKLARKAGRPDEGGAQPGDDPERTARSRPPGASAGGDPGATLDGATLPPVSRDALMAAARDESVLSDTGIDLNPDSTDDATIDPPTLDDLPTGDQFDLEPYDADAAGSGSGSDPTFDDDATRDFLLAGDTGATMPAYRAAEGALDATLGAQAQDTLSSATSLGDTARGVAMEHLSLADTRASGTSLPSMTSTGSGWDTRGASGGTTAAANTSAAGSLSGRSGETTAPAVPAVPAAAGAMFVPRAPRRTPGRLVGLAAIPTALLALLSAGAYFYWDSLAESFVKPGFALAPQGSAAAPAPRPTSAPPASALPLDEAPGTQAPAVASPVEPASPAVSAASAGSAAPVEPASPAAAGSDSTGAPVVTAAADGSLQSSAAPAPATRSATTVAVPPSDSTSAPAPTAATVPTPQVATSQPAETPERGAPADFDPAFESPFPPAQPRVGVGRVAARASRSGVQIARRAQPARVSPYVSRGYEAYRQGNLEAARIAYAEALRRRPRSRDALLGLAAVALREGRTREAAGAYHTLLGFNPRDENARAGLLAVEGAADAPASEGEVRTLLRANPDSAVLHAGLANLYVGQGRWPEAQQAYFDAHRLAPDNADYAFNLAVSLDHLAKPSAAVGFYRRALELAAQGHASFDQGAAARRVAEISGG